MLHTSHLPPYPPALQGVLLRLMRNLFTGRLLLRAGNVLGHDSHLQSTSEYVEVGASLGSMSEG